MPQVDLIEESFVVATPAAVAATVRDATRWRGWWPDLSLTVFQDRGEQGVRWNVTGALVGSMEVWLEPHGDGVILHHYLRADLPAGPATGTDTGRAATNVRPGRLVRETRRRSRHAKRIFWALKDELEGNRGAGEPCAVTR